MSRQAIHMVDGTMLVIGYDRPFSTWYAQHYDDNNPHKAPRAVIGYSPVEQQVLHDERPEAVIGPYPVEDAEELVTKLIPQFMGVEAYPPQLQPMCHGCGLPPWRPNPGCLRHPYEVLRYG